MYSLSIESKEHDMSGKKIGYLRVSTLLQNEERQLSGIELDKEFVEKASAEPTSSKNDVGLHP